jgi:hypothetical protein
MSPTARTLAYLRKQGMVCQVVERFNPFCKIRIDLFGCIDIVAVSETNIIGIQATSGSNHSARKKKILESDILPLWKKAGGVIKLISWIKNKKNRWIAREEIF